MQSFVYMIGGQDGQSVRVSPDMRKSAGFGPAVVIDVAVPAGAAPLEFIGAIQQEAAGHWQDIVPERVEVWVLRSGPRSPTLITYGPQFVSRSIEAKTIYKMFLRFAAHQKSRLQLPRLRAQAIEVQPPRFNVFASEPTQLVQLSPAQSEA